MSLSSPVPSQQPISQRIRRVLTKMVGKKDVAIPPNDLKGPHWRKSINAKLPNIRTSNKNSQRHIKEHDTLEDNKTAQTSKLLQLPRELRHQIEESLHRVDILCLRQTCRRLHQESQCKVSVRDLNARQLYNFRQRLDRGSYPVLCSREEEGKLSSRQACCSFCLSVHTTTAFTTQHLLKVPAQRRICSAAQKNYLICGSYSTTPTMLRKALDTVLATGREAFKIHHWMPSQLSEKEGHIVLSRAIENNTRLAERRSSLYVSETSGLVLEHHFHLHPLCRMRPLRYYIASALADHERTAVLVCPHLSILAAGVQMGIPEDYDDEEGMGGRCGAEGCRTEFAWFECRGEPAGREELCFRVTRRFGWVEDLGDAFWRSQEG